MASIVTSFPLVSGCFPFPAGGEDFGAHIAAGFSPFVVLLGENRADKAQDGVAVGEDADHIGPSADHHPRYRWSLLIKAIIKHFCPAFAPGGVVLCIGGDTEKKFVHLERGAISELGVSLSSAARIPDVIVHYAAKNWLLLIEAVTSAGPVDDKRLKELQHLFAGCKAGLVFVTAFESRRRMQSFASRIAWGSVVWIAEIPIT